MTVLIDGPCWQVPVPASDSSQTANLVLARAISVLVPGARAKPAIASTQPVESSTERRRRGLCGLQPDEHPFVRTVGPMEPLPLYFVDNVIATGNNSRRPYGAGLGDRLGLRRCQPSIQQPPPPSCQAKTRSRNCLLETRD
jgi:hypothetical protein